jgi:mannose-6-phosphate isomerase-like protein (cupin superfamily)
MDPEFIQPEESDEFFTDERCSILEILNNPNDRSQSLARARVEPGTTTAWHRLKDTSETYYILSGKGRVELGEDFIQEVKAGDAVKIPANTAQRIQNIGEEDLVFLCFCVPAFGAESYEDLE